MDNHIKTVGVLGGTGALGGGLAFRLSKAGFTVILGSRSEDKAQTAAVVLRSEAGGENIHGATNQDMAVRSDLVIVAVPFAGRDDLLVPLREIRSSLVYERLMNSDVRRRVSADRVDRLEPVRRP